MIYFFLPLSHPVFFGWGEERSACSFFRVIELRKGILCLMLPLLQCTFTHVSFFNDIHQNRTRQANKQFFIQRCPLHDGGDDDEEEAADREESRWRMLYCKISPLDAPLRVPSDSGRAEMPFLCRSSARRMSPQVEQPPSPTTCTCKFPSWSPTTSALP